MTRLACMLVLTTAFSWAQDSTTAPLSPAESAERFDVADDLEFQQVLAEPLVRQPLSMKFDERGRLWVVQYIQYPNPAGLKMVSRDSYWRAVYDKKPVAPPNHVRGLDRITIHEDSDADGVFDTHSVFLEGTSITTSFEFDDDGVWVLNPPYLLFYPDADRDDVPDGDPIVHLDGFGIEDTHSNANSLCFGPDGWLYGAQGSTVSGRIVRPGIDTQPVTSMGQLIWRYHPVTRRYEIFAEGGGNAFGVEFDSKGRVFSGHNGGNTRGFHYVQGGYFQKGFSKHGPLSNPYAFGYFSWMGHHQVPRFTHDFVIYEGGALPPKYDGLLFGVGPLQSHLVMSEVSADGSTLKTKDLGHPVQSRDTRFRPVEITVGPDGAIYVADFYEQQISHRQHFDGQIEKDTGRIYRLKARGAGPTEPFDLRAMPTDDLVHLLRHPNRWFRHAAVRLLRQRGDLSAVPQLLDMIRETEEQVALDALWAVYGTSGLSESLTAELLQHGNPWVRAWTVRLACDDGHVASGTAAALQQLARDEPHAAVRSQLAASARRIATEHAFPVVAALSRHDEDAGDPHIPLLLWWAIEARAETDRDAIVSLFEDPGLRGHAIVKQHLLERVMRRFARAGKRRDLLAAARLLRAVDEPEGVAALMRGFEKAYEGRPLSGLPDELMQAIAARGGGSEVLQVRQRKPEALSTAIAVVGDANADTSRRVQLIEALRDLRHQPALDVLLKVATGSESEPVQSAALVALQAFDAQRVPTELLAEYARLSASTRPIALTTLTSRPAWARVALGAVASGAISRDDFDQTTIWRLQRMPDESVTALTKEIWGEARGATSAELKQRVESYELAIREDVGDPYEGKRLFTDTCGKCHRLFDSGGQIGPELTSYKRDDLTRMLLNIVDPSAEIREGYETWLCITEDGRTVTGFKIDEDDEVVVLRGTDGQNVTISKGTVEELVRQPISLMPQGLLDKMNDQQKRDLFAYLRSSQPLNNSR